MKTVLYPHLQEFLQIFNIDYGHISNVGRTLTTIIKLKIVKLCNSLNKKINKTKNPS